jgi:hypothetical protein
MKIRIQDTYDIDFIKRDTGGREKFNSSKHLKRWKRSFSKNFVSFWTKELKNTKKMEN